MLARRSEPMVVLTVDDHPLIRSALREVLALLAERVELVEAVDPEGGLAAVRRRPEIDLIFLDLHFARHDGLGYIEKFRAAVPAAPLIVYTMHEDAPTLKQALARGAVGIVPKTHSAKLMQRAIALVMDGGIYLPPELARQVSGPEVQLNGMSEQQTRILDYLAQGLANKEIARNLGIAPSTVKNQLTVVFEKLGVANRTQAAMAARALLNNRKEASTARRST
jgi:DNA-binding NarL/FixJ family response regulator